MGGIVDAITGQSQRRAQKSADESLKTQKEIISRIVKLFDTNLSKVEGAEKSGLFDPDKQIALADESLMRNKELDRQASAGTARTLGYRPGDSAPITQDRKISQDYDLKLRMQNFGIRQQSMQNLLNAYNAISPAGVQGAAGSAGQMAQTFSQQAAQPNPFLNAATNYFAMQGMGGGGGGGGFNQGGATGGYGKFGMGSWA